MNDTLLVVYPALIVLLMAALLWRADLVKFREGWPHICWMRKLTQDETSGVTYDVYVCRGYPKCKTGTRKPRRAKMKAL